MNRKKSREVAMKLLYEMSINKESYGIILKNFKENRDDENSEVELNDIDFQYVEDVLKGVEERFSEINQSIEEHLVNWKISRISKINLAILRMCVYEILFMDEIPPRVSVNEGIELAKKYSEDKAPKFINGVLGNYINNK